MRKDKTKVLVGDGEGGVEAVVSDTPVTVDDDGTVTGAASADVSATEVDVSHPDAEQPDLPEDFEFPKCSKKHK